MDIQDINRYEPLLVSLLPELSSLTRSLVTETQLDSRQLDTLIRQLDRRDSSTGVTA